MLKKLIKTGLFSIVILPLIINAQVDGRDNISLEQQEKKLVDDAYALYNSNDKTTYKTAHRLLKTLKAKRSLVNMNLLLAHYFTRKTLVDSSIYYVNKSLKYHLANDSLETRMNASRYNLLAINYSTKGLFEESKKWHLKGIEEAKKIDNKFLYYTNTHGLARVYSKLGNLEQSLKLFKECLKSKDEPEIIMGSYINIGNIYAEQKDFKASESYLKKGLELADKINRISALAVIKIALASNAKDQGKLDEAIVLCKEAIKISKENELNQLEIIAQMDFGSVLIDAKKYQEAELIYYNILDDVVELGYLDQQLNVYENLKTIALNLSDYKKALNATTKYFEVKDSIDKLQKDKEINELEVKYKTLQKENEIEFLQVENANKILELKTQREALKNLKLQQELENKESENKILSIKNASEKTLNENILLKKNQEIREAKLEAKQIEATQQKEYKNIILYSSLITLIPIIGLLFMYYKRLQTQNELSEKREEVNKQKMSSVIKDQELKLIKASVEGQDKERKRIAQELHDSIGGNLAAIKLQLSNAINSDKELKRINDQIDNTYEQVRSLSHNLIPKKFGENTFCDVLEEYFNNIGSASNLSTSFRVYPRNEIDHLEEHLQIEVFKISQELITNTIKHAKATSIELQLNLVENVLNILFEDNGIGFNTDEKIDGIGYRNIKNRLTKVSGSLHIDSRINRGAIINITIPKHNKQLLNEV